jgi:hypothetical protein
VQIHTVVRQGDLFVKQEQLFSAAQVGPTTLLTVDMDVETEMAIPADGQERGHRRRRRAACPVGGRGDLQTVHGPCPADRYDPEPVAVLVDELTDQRCSGSHSRAKKLVAALGISIVYSSSRRLLCSSRISRAASVVTPRASSPAST